jgi:hypothetical protein
MRLAAAIAGCLVVGFVLMDAFNTLILARRTGQSFHLTRTFYRLTWPPFAAAARRVKSGRKREGILGVYGPLSLVLIMVVWAAALVLGFTSLQWAAGMKPARVPGTLPNDLYLSATTFFTLETGEPANPLSKWITAIEGGLGLSFLGLVISYLPVFYQAFSKRELEISLLDARAGSPPSAADLLEIEVSNPRTLERYLESWEQWAAELLESQLSFPMLAWFRSHHANQSWVTALTAMTDSAAVISLCADGDLKTQAEFTFAMGRHVFADIAAIFELKPPSGTADRLPESVFFELRRTLGRSSTPLRPERLQPAKLLELRQMYEPHAEALSAHLLMALPSWTPHDASRENWKGPKRRGDEVHFAVSDPFHNDSGR